MQTQRLAENAYVSDYEQVKRGLCFVLVSQQCQMEEVRCMLHCLPLLIDCSQVAKTKDLTFS